MDTGQPRARGRSQSVTYLRTRVSDGTSATQLELSRVTVTMAVQAVQAVGPPQYRCDRGSSVYGGFASGVP